MSDHDIADDMCPNCLTPWKCNGPHLDDQTLRSSIERGLAQALSGQARRRDDFLDQL